MSVDGFSVEDVARLAGVDVSTIRRWARGRNPVLTPSHLTRGGHRRYSQSDLLAAEILGLLRSPSDRPEDGMSTKRALRTLRRLQPTIDAAMARVVSTVAAQSLGTANFHRSPR